MKKKTIRRKQPKNTSQAASAAGQWSMLTLWLGSMASTATLVWMMFVLN